MATQMERITKFLSEFGCADAKIVMDIADVPKSRLYEIAKQKSATFVIKNGSIYPKYPEIVEGRQTIKEDAPVEECKRQHVTEEVMEKLRDGMADQVAKDMEEATKDMVNDMRTQIRGEIWDEMGDNIVPEYTNKHYLFMNYLQKYNDDDLEINVEEEYDTEMMNAINVVISAYKAKQIPDFEDIAPALKIFLISLHKQLAIISE